MMIITSQNIHGIFTTTKSAIKIIVKVGINDSINIYIINILVTASSLSMHAKDYDHTVLTCLACM